MRNNYITEIIKRTVKEVLSEMAKANLPFREFESDMENMGFVRRNGEGSSKVFVIPEYGDASAVTVHAHDNRSPMDGNALRQVKKVLNSIGWFKEPDNYEKFPFKKWEISDNDIEVDTTKQKIEDANKKYKDAEVFPAFPMKDSICVLQTKYGVNLCRSPKDRRTLLPKWYERYGHHGEKGIPCLDIDNYDELRTECYPIKTNGTLDYENVLFENRKHGNKSINRQYL